MGENENWSGSVFFQQRAYARSLYSDMIRYTEAFDLDRI